MNGNDLRRRGVLVVRGLACCAARVLARKLLEDLVVFLLLLLLCPERADGFYYKYEQNEENYQRCRRNREAEPVFLQKVLRAEADARYRGGEDIVVVVGSVLARALDGEVDAPAVVYGVREVRLDSADVRVEAQPRDGLARLVDTAGGVFGLAEEIARDIAELLGGEEIVVLKLLRIRTLGHTDGDGQRRGAVHALEIDVVRVHLRHDGVVVKSEQLEILRAVGRVSVDDRDVLGQ